jgi:hypothetical protein
MFMFKEVALAADTRTKHTALAGQANSKRRGKQVHPGKATRRQEALAKEALQLLPD